MSNKLLVFVFTIIIIISFTMGAIASETSVVQTVKLKLMSDIRGSSTTILEGIEDDVRVVVEKKLNETSDIELGRATAEIQTYFNSKIQAAGDSPEVLEAITGLETITDILIQEGKDQIDAAVSNIFSVN